MSYLRSPEITESPTAPKVLVIGGAGADYKVLEGLTDALSSNGLDAYSFDYGTVEPSDVDGSVDQKQYQDTKVYQAAEAVGEITEEGEKITLFGHSLGGVVALRAAMSCPDKVDRVVLSNSEGLFYNTFPRLAGRFALELFARKNNTITKLGRRQTWRGLRDIVKHPVAFVGNAIDGARTDAYPLIEQLRQQGIEVDVIQSNAEVVYPARRVQKAAELRAIRNEKREDIIEELPFSSFSLYNGVKRTRRGKARSQKLAAKYAGHDQPIIYPEYAAKIVAQLVDPESDLASLPKVKKRPAA